MIRGAVILVCVVCMGCGFIYFSSNKSAKLEPVKMMKKHVVKKKMLADLGL